MSGTKVTKASLAKRVRSLIAGTQKHTPNGSLTFGGATYAAAALVQLLQGLADALDASDADKARWQDALTRMQDEKGKVGPVVRAYQTWLVATLGNAPSTLADYGLTPPKARTPPTADQKAAAVAKREATRAARHTMGKTQKKAIKGTVPQAVPVDGGVHAPTPAPSTAPATTPATPGPKPAS